MQVCQTPGTRQPLTDWLIKHRQNGKSSPSSQEQWNTPCPVSGLSPAQIVYGRVLKDFLPLQPGKFQPRQEWRQAATDRAAAYAKRHIAKGEQMSNSSKPLQPLKTGDQVAVQNQRGQNPRQWHQTGVVIEVGPHNSYHVSIDGSRTITKRNRQFLRKIQPFQNLSPNPTSKPAPSPLDQHDVIPQAVQHDQQPAQHPQHEEVVQQTISQVPADGPPTDSNDNVSTPQHIAPTDPTPSSTNPKVRQRPRHVRERWIVADPTPATAPTGAMAPVQYVPYPSQPYPYHVPVPSSPTVAQIYPGHPNHPYSRFQTYPGWPMMHNVANTVLPYMMMPQQDSFNPVMNKFSSS